MKISELLDSIRKSDLVLPEFQREYVWTLDQAKQLMVSLRRETLVCAVAALWARQARVLPRFGRP